MSVSDIRLEALGEAWRLRFSIKAFAFLERHFELSSLDEIEKRLNANISTGDLVGLFLAGFQSNHSEVTQDQVLDIIDELGVPGALELIQEGFNAAAPKEEKGGAKSPPTKTGRSTP